MPQMMPMSWLSLYIMFLLIFMLFNITNYYINIKVKENKLMKSTTKNKSMNWKW
uniref:ATP synthase F0 subunit 8 n=1 Tax=Balta jinlinorum TaxID=1928763 RepID=UPI0027AA081B|nr:ATP synthase F0 subunit 8 [Balta jinlinorum]WGO57096.1 ATP synthase F0 subunit 8 [Balta jinlinorum]